LLKNPLKQKSEEESRENYTIAEVSNLKNYWCSQYYNGGATKIVRNDKALKSQTLFETWLQATNTFKFQLFCNAILSERVWQAWSTL